jgi:uncharacterized membrane protein
MQLAYFNAKTVYMRNQFIPLCLNQLAMLVAQIITVLAIVLAIVPVIMIPMIMEALPLAVTLAAAVAMVAELAVIGNYTVMRCLT